MPFWVEPFSFQLLAALRAAAASECVNACVDSSFCARSVVPACCPFHEVTGRSASADAAAVPSFVQEAVSRVWMVPRGRLPEGGLWITGREGFGGERGPPCCTEEM